MTSQGKTPSNPSPDSTTRLEGHRVSDSPWDKSALHGNPHQRPDKAQRVREMFTAIAHAYDLNNRVHSFGLDQFWRRRAVGLAHPVDGALVLDVACGTGDLAISFAKAKAESVVGLDYTPAMLDHARAKAARSGGRVAQIRFVHGDAHELQYDDGTFDIVSIAFGIRNVADPSKAIREFKRVLRPGGRLVILEFSQPPSRIVRFVHGLYTNHVMPWTATILARDVSGAYRYLPRSVETFLDPNQIAEQLFSAGFSKVSQHSLTMGTCVITVGRLAN